MAYFPQSLMPARVKSEAADVDGNRYIMSGDDHNRLDAEIRAIEKALLGVQTGGGGTGGTTAQCSTLEILLAIAKQIQLIRDTMVDSTSGVVAVKDDAVPGVDGIIPFPAAWCTVLVSDIPDDTTTDEQELPALDSIEVDDVSNMPNEGFITIINDVSFGGSYVPHMSEMKMWSPAKANGKIGLDFSYEILITGNPDLQVTGLPAGLVYANNSISGKPTTAGTSTITIRATQGTVGSQAAVAQNFSLSISVWAATTPNITAFGSSTPVTTLTTAASANQKLEYNVGYLGAVVQMTTTGLPAGLTFYGRTISGTPREAGVYPVDLTITDEFGSTASAILTITVVE